MTRLDAEATREVTRALEAVGVRYCVAGSAASSFHGSPRSTVDVDLLASLRPEHVAPLVELLGDDFYVDEEAVRLAVASRGSFNLIHLRTSYKIDVFIPPAHRAAQIDRASPARVFGPDEAEYPVASAEDTVVAKLVWFEEGGRTSERQWADVLGILRISGQQLDIRLLREEAGEAGVESLLQRAMREAELPPFSSGR